MPYRSSVASNQEICCNCLGRPRPSGRSSWTNRTNSSGQIPLPLTKMYRNVPRIFQNLPGHNCYLVPIVRCVVWRLLLSVHPRNRFSSACFVFSIAILRGLQISIGSRTVDCARDAFQKCEFLHKVENDDSFSRVVPQGHISEQSYGRCRRNRAESCFQRSRVHFIRQGTLWAQVAG